MIEPTDLINVRWKTTTCREGEDCWCRGIVPEVDIQFRDGVNAWVIPNGQVPRVEAEHIVDVHNRFIDEQAEAGSVDK